MSDVVFRLAGVQLKEVGGEGSTDLATGELTVTSTGASGVVAVDGTLVPIVGACKKLGREYQLATPDVMSWLYLTLPSGQPAETYAQFEALLDALVAREPLPKLPAPAAAAAAPAVATAAAAGAAAGATGPAAAAAPPDAGGGGIAEMLKNIADKAAHDTMMVANAIKQKAEHDTQLFQQQLKAAEEERKAKQLAEASK